MYQINIFGRYFGNQCFPSLNDYLKEVVTNPRVNGNTFKQKYENIVVRAARQSLKTVRFRTPVRIHYIFGEVDDRRDYSNVVAFAVKVIEDGLQKAGMLRNDNQECVLPYTFSFERTKNPYIKIQIYEMENDSMQNFTCIGNVCGDPTIKQTANGKTITSFNVAVRRKYANGGQDVDYFNCVAFGNTGDYIQKYFRKGMKVAVTGVVHIDRTEKDGEKKTWTSVVANEVEIAERKGTDTSEEKPSNSGDGFMNIPQGIDDEMPFN